MKAFRGHAEPENKVKGKRNKINYATKTNTLAKRVIESVLPFFLPFLSQQQSKAQEWRNPITVGVIIAAMTFEPALNSAHTMAHLNKTEAPLSLPPLKSQPLDLAERGTHYVVMEDNKDDNDMI